MTDAETQAQQAIKSLALPDVPAFEILSREEYEIAADNLKTLIAKKKEVEAARKSITTPLDHAKKRVQDLFMPVLNHFDTAEKQLRRALLDYTTKQEQERREQEARLRDEHAKAIAEAEEEAERLLESGDIYTADVVANPPVPVPTVITATPKVNGLYTRPVWKAEVTNLMEFLLYVVENDAFHLITINQSALDSMARTSKGMANVKGVTFKEEQTLVARS